MGLAGFAPETIKPTALALNILVSALACIRFYRAGLLTWRVCYPFGVLGLPFSLVGGALHLPSATYQPVVGILLAVAGLQMLRVPKARAARTGMHAPFVLALLIGGVIGLVSGVTGVGGGIFLAPAILAFGWADTRQTAAISATFNLINSAAALGGVWATMPMMPATLPLWLACVGGGGIFGSWLGERHLRPPTLRLILATLLLASAVRMLAASL